MSNIPPFSLFSAISEVFVTIGVLYSINQGMKGKLPKKLLGCVLLFELCVNVVYMIGRAAAADKSTELSTNMKLFFAAHGTLSLLMFLGIGTIYLWSLYGLSKDEDNWFARHKTGSWVVVFFWMVSVLSGEAIFFMRYVL